MNARVERHAEPTTGSEEEFLTRFEQWWSGGVIAIHIFVLALAALYDLFIDPVLASHGWNGASAGVLGGLIGGYVFLHAQTVDHETFTLNARGRGRPRREHVAYIRSRLMLAVPSGFVMSTVVAATIQNPTPALLTSFGILGGFSCTLLSALALAAEAGAKRYVSKSVFGVSTSSASRVRNPAQEPTDAAH
mgnify:CR=1 FL=1